MKKVITYTEEQISNIRMLLNGLTVTGTQNCKQIAVIDQVLSSGIPAEVNDNKNSGKEGEG